MDLPPQTDSQRRLYVLLLRWALGTAFLSAVADRFGLWGIFGQPNVAWGDMTHFLTYTARVVSYLPASLVPFVGWLATIAEIVLGIGLLFGLFPRIMALGSAVLLLLFALSMSVSLGVKAPLNFSVFTASAAAFLLFNLEQSAPHRVHQDLRNSSEQRLLADAQGSATSLQHNSNRTARVSKRSSLIFSHFPQQANADTIHKFHSSKGV